MKWFGRKAGRDESRPVLARGNGPAGDWALGEWPRTYEAQVRDGYCLNAVAQRAVRLVAEGVASAPLEASRPELEALVGARSGGRPFLEGVAAQMLLHGNAFVAVMRDGEGGVDGLFALRPERVVEDRLRVSRATFLAGEAASVPLVEVRES